jgi:hypothetical protein
MNKVPQGFQAQMERLLAQFTAATEIRVLSPEEQDLQTLIAKSPESDPITRLRASQQVLVSSKLVAERKLNLEADPAAAKSAAAEIARYARQLEQFSADEMLKVSNTCINEVVNAWIKLRKSDPVTAFGLARQYATEEKPRFANRSIWDNESAVVAREALANPQIRRTLAETDPATAQAMKDQIAAVQSRPSLAAKLKGRTVVAPAREPGAKPH